MRVPIEHPATPLLSVWCRESEWPIVLPREGAKEEGNLCVGSTVRYRGDLWRVTEVMPWGSVVIRRPAWSPSWWPFGGVRLVAREELRDV